MSKKSNDRKQGDKSQPQYIIHHTKYNLLTCVCGEVLKSRHKCERWIKIQVAECNGDECDTCTKMKIEHRFKEQWGIDEDGYSVCSYCRIKCEDGTIPKECECSGYINEDEYILQYM